MSTEGTHVEHCCLKHGCKYGYSDDADSLCPVASGRLKQAYPCEFCAYEAEAMEERGEHYEYAVYDRQEDGSEVVTPVRSLEYAKELRDGTTYPGGLKRRRVSEWEEFE